MYTFESNARLGGRLMEALRRRRREGGREGGRSTAWKECLRKSLSRPKVSMCILGIAWEASRPLIWP